MLQQIVFITSQICGPSLLGVPKYSLAHEHFFNLPNPNVLTLAHGLIITEVF